MSRTYEDILPGNHQIFATTRFDREAVFDFFVVFSRAEYALKATGFVSGGSYGEPKVKWRDFANTLKDRLCASNDGPLAEAYAYLSDHPPRQQVLEHGQLQWRSRTRRANQSAEAFLIESVTTVRNNLFHGGKELTTPLTERDRTLVRAALLVLAHAISLSNGVCKAFVDAGPDVAVA